MTHIFVLYASDYGHTREAARAVAEGAERIAGSGVRCLPTCEVGTKDLEDADALILGSPVHMGSLHWEIKRFIDQSLAGLWTRDRLVGRVGGVFATGGGLGGAGGGCELAMLSMFSVLAELGMLLVPLPKRTARFEAGGLHWGPYARCGSDAKTQTEVPGESLRLLGEHGANVARVAALTASQPRRSAFFDRTEDANASRRSI